MLCFALIAQGSIRENSDPLGLHSDRDMMSLLKHVGLWDVLAGLSLSRFKATGQPIPAAISYPSSVASSVPTGGPCWNLLIASCIQHLQCSVPSVRRHEMCLSSAFQDQGNKAA